MNGQILPVTVEFGLMIAAAILAAAALIRPLFDALLCFTRYLVKIGTSRLRLLSAMIE